MFGKCFLSVFGWFGFILALAFTICPVLRVRGLKERGLRMK